MNATTSPVFGTPMTIDAPITLRLPRGAAVFAVQGEAWITQDGSLDDVFLRAGQRFDVPSRAPLVISATRGQVELYVVGPAAAGTDASRDLRDFLRAYAADLRRAEADRLLDAMVQRVRVWLQRARTAVSPRLRVPTH